MARKTRLVTWNGKDLPPEFRGLPVGGYVVEAVMTRRLPCRQSKRPASELPLSRTDKYASDTTRARQIVAAALGR